MPEEVLRLLNPQPGMTMVDGTVGTGGHSLLLMPRLMPGGRLMAMDRDPQALQIARQRLSAWGTSVTFVQGNFIALADVLKEHGVAGVDGILLDLGMSSLQVETAERGFSFLREGPLDMRMDPGQSMSAEAIINRWPLDQLATMFETLGEERFARRIAQRIIAARRAHPITSTTQLAALICEAVPSRFRHGRVHVATRAFQALRMAVNDELGSLQAALESLPAVLARGGRAVVIAFHSLEDRLVKQAAVRGMREGMWQALTKKPLRPSEDEIARNPRARSAKLRAVEFVSRQPSAISGQPSVG
jgi:16S rRNA (cytosine1402-N4)-methyltransferase